MRNFFFFFLFLFSLQGTAQSGLVAYFPFDRCGEIEEVTGINNSVVSEGFVNGIGCACGVRDSAIVFGGTYVDTANGGLVDDQVYLIGNYDNYFDEDDFTISVYIKPTNLTGIRTIYSKLDDCNSETGFQLRYTAANNFLTAYVGESSSKKVELFGKLNLDNCWHHVVLVKKGNRVFLYADGELVDDAPTVSAMDISNGANFILGSGPCVGTLDLPFEGHIDELRVYNRAVPVDEIQEKISFKTDFISNRPDTLIVDGTSVDINLGSTCATSFSWSPSDPMDGVDDPFNPETSITPPQPGNYEYVLAMAHPEGCVAKDTIKIQVVDPDSLDCSEIFLPKAFTPNGDGLNDVFGVSNPYAIVNFVSFEIFDRWGGRVFYTENVYEGWNGNFKGKKVKPGVCMYRVVYNCLGEEKIKVGSLTILR